MNLKQFILLWNKGLRVQWSCHRPQGLIFDLHCPRKELSVVTFKFWDCIAVLMREASRKKKPRKCIVCTILMGSHLIALVHKLH